MTIDQQPWLTNPDWIRKRVPGIASPNEGARSASWFTCAVALVIGAVGLFLKGTSTWNRSIGMFLLLLIFPAIGLGLLCWNVLLRVRTRKYSGAYFEMDSLPFFVGHNLTGRIQLPSGVPLPRPVQVTLNCIRRRKSSSRGMTGASKITWDELVWRAEKLDDGMGPAAQSESTSIPVEFSIPSDAPITSSANPDDQILWSLKAQAKTRGANLVQYFEVPVFATSGTPARPEYGDLNFYAPIAVSLPPKASSGHRHVVIRPSDGGGTEFLFLANRHWGVARFATAACCIWTAVIRYFFWTSDSLSFSLFVFADVLLLYWAVWSWFSTSSASFENGTVTVRNSLFGISKSRQIAYGEVRQITSPITSESGQGAEAIPSYAIYLQTSSQGTVEVAGGLKDAGEAGYIVERMQAEINAYSGSPGRSRSQQLV